MELNKIYEKSSETMAEINDATIDLIVTSPPYNIDISYGNRTKKGKTIDSKGVKYSDNLDENEYRQMLERVFNECKRVLKDDGSIWINIKNRYSQGRIITPNWIEGYFQDMYLKNLVIWNFDWGGSTNTRLAPRYEFLFWYSKKADGYKFNLDRIKVPSLNYRPDRYKDQLKNPSDVWRISMVSGNFKERTNHPAQYPERLIERVILSCSNEGDVVLDPFMGSGTTAVVAQKLSRYYLGYEIVHEYNKMSTERLKQAVKEESDGNLWGEL